MQHYNPPPLEKGNENKMGTVSYNNLKVDLSIVNLPGLTKKVRNKETNEEMDSRNKGTGQDSNLERPKHEPLS